jgi:DNA topoisomerase III
MQLLLCEKPSQAKDIAPHVGAKTRGDGCITGDGVAVTWCIGHLLEQAKPEAYDPALKFWDLQRLPVLPAQWQMNVKESVQKQFDVVSRLLSQASSVIIATDADREGEVIAREVMERCRYAGPVQRLWLSALNPASIKKALGSLLPGSKTQPLYLSGLGRARADWLAGMNMTMALTKAYGIGKGSAAVNHCGRVQTPVLALVVRRERAIAAFKPTSYFELDSRFKVHGQTIDMKWVPDAARCDAQGHCTDAAYVAGIADAVRGQTGSISNLATTAERELAPLLFSLGSLQREASAKHGMKAQTVLDCAQSLYETHKLTSYPRVDCEYIPVSMMSEIPEVLEAVAKIDPSLSRLVAQCDQTAKPRTFNDAKLTMHHAIIPKGRVTGSLSALNANEKILYGLICRRYLAQFLGDHLFDKTVMQVTCAGALFKATGKVVRSEGWKVVNAAQVSASSATAPAARSKAPADEVEVVLPAAKVGDAAHNIQCDAKRNSTKAPKRYTEGTLIAAMESIDKEIEDPRWREVMRNKEKAGIGTDATRSAVIENLFKREYVANQAKTIIPTERGNALIALIEKVSPALADPVLTAQWEDRLSMVESGQLPLQAFETELGAWLQKIIDQVKTQAIDRRPSLSSPAPAQSAQPIPAAASRPPSSGAPASPRAAPVAAKTPSGELMICSACAKPMALRNGPRGQFIGCTGYPACKATKPVPSGTVSRPSPTTAKPNSKANNSTAAAPSAKPTYPRGEIGQTCPTCSKGKLTLKTSPRLTRPFIGCTNFPECRYFIFQTQGAR